MADEPLAPPTLFDDPQIAELEKTVHALIQPAHAMTEVVHSAWNMLQELKASRRREASLAALARTHAAGRREAEDRARAAEARRDEVAATANEHYAARQQLEAENAKLAGEIGRLRDELAKTAPAPAPADATPAQAVTTG
jgi:uncharacterized coiled-coil DUF342 family protein